MAIFKCKMCGGDLEINGASTVAECIYCGTQQTLPKLDDDRKANLYDRANHFRRNNDFDKAMGIYEQILNTDTTDAEAYWSLVLCHYGIEYVEDPATHKRVPTVNRAQFTSIFDDANYKSALEYADVSQKQIYENEAKAINEIQKGILAISQNEEPFDVFICYKETDANGRRTPDSVLANDLYHQLTQEGFKVFFSRITLEDKLGTAYEPYIFAALNSSKVMVVLGTKPEYFNAVWVKNEWSRYLTHIKSGANKILIPAYKDMDPYDLPEEFSHLQAQDMSKLGFMQDLIRGIKKLTHADEPKTTLVKETVVTPANNNTAPLLKRAFMFLEDGEWERADDFCEQVLNLDPECPDAYLGKLMADLRVEKQDNLKNCSDPFDNNSNYQKAVRFADDKLKTKLKADIEYIKERNENTRKENVLKEAKSKIAKNDLNECKSALLLLNSISGFKDANDQIKICKDNIQKLEEKAESDRIEQEKQAVIAKKKAEESRKKAAKIFALVASIICVLVAFVFLLTFYIIPNSDYKKAVVLMEEGKSEEAIAAFEELDGFKDSEEKILSIKYDDAVALKEEGKTDEAIAAFEDLGDYADSTDQIKAIQYDEAVKLAENKKTQDAFEAFEALGDYKDSAQRAEELKFDYNMRKCKSAWVGSTVKFGSYEQDNNESNGKEDIEWKVLEKKDNRILVVSKYALDFKQYNNIRVRSTWDDCTLRTWMNEDFFNTAFSSKEQALIPTVTVPSHSGYDNGGYDEYYEVDYNVSKSTQDKVFILSGYELEKYFGVDTDGYVREFSWEPTDYAMAQGVNDFVYAWLRSSDLSTDEADTISDSKRINEMGGGEMVNDFNLICPAMWIELK